MRSLLVSLLSLIVLTSVAHAEINDTAHDSGNTADIAVYVGKFSALRDTNSESVEGAVEYRFKDQWYGLRPAVGIMANTDSALYGYAGIDWDLPIRAIRPFYITPGVKVGGYAQGDSKDLGYGVEFRDSIEVAYRFNDGERLGAYLTHMSNASLGNSNPGTEMIGAVYSHPF